MNEVRSVVTKSSPNLAAVVTASEQQHDDPALDGVTANLNLLLKLIEDHKDACGKEGNDSRRMLRVATMMTILDNVKTRIQKCQSFGDKRPQAALRRCNTDLRPNHHPPKDKRPGGEVVVVEKEKLRRELHGCLAARKSLEMMCSSSGKEKEIMAAELSRKTQELSEMEELVNDLKAQNQKLVRKVQECASKHKDNKCIQGEESHWNVALKERNKFSVRFEQI